MIYRRPGFLASYDLAPPQPPRPLGLPSVSWTGDSQEDREKETTCWPERARGGYGGVVGDNSCDGEKAWSSINHSILSGLIAHSRCPTYSIYSEDITSCRQDQPSNGTRIGKNKPKFSAVSRHSHNDNLPFIIPVFHPSVWQVEAVTLFESRKGERRIHCQPQLFHEPTALSYSPCSYKLKVQRWFRMSSLLQEQEHKLKNEPFSDVITDDDPSCGYQISTSSFCHWSLTSLWPSWNLFVCDFVSFCCMIIIFDHSLFINPLMRNSVCSQANLEVRQFCSVVARLFNYIILVGLNLLAVPSLSSPFT